MFPFIENSRQCKLIYHDKLVISWGLEDQGRRGERETAKGYKETSVGDRFVPSLEYGDGFMGAYECQDFIF